MSADFARLVEWELTRACNLACVHCYIRHGKPRRYELTTQEARRVATSLARSGCASVTLSGGEPLLRRDWPEIASTLVDGGAAVQIISNGIGIQRQTALKARSAGVRMVLLSLDGMEAAHDRIRRRRGAFKAVLRAADALGEAGVRFGFMTTLLRPNAADLEPMAELIRRLGGVLWQVWLAIPRDRDKLWLRPDESSQLVTELLRLREVCPQLLIGDTIGYFDRCEKLRHPDLATSSAGGLFAAIDALPHFTCESGRGVLGLQSDGFVRGCLALPEKWNVGSLRRHDLAALRQLSLDARRRRIAALASACRGCKFVALCLGGCHAMALAPSGQEYCLQRPRLAGRKSGVARKASTVAASLILASALAAGCRPQPTADVPVPGPEPVAVAGPEDASVQETAAADAVPPGADDECVCESEEKDEQGKPVSVEPCLCISHMMCPPSTMLVCPEGTTKVIRKKDSDDPAGK
jgi:radical SAM protein with 4Fe4S-binding SPASM domain